MFPRFAVKRIADSRRANAEHPGDAGLTGAGGHERVDVRYLLLAQLCAWVFIASSPFPSEAASLSVLGAHVGHVVGLCSKEQVIWFDASPVVAGMADIEPVCYWPVSNGPSVSVRSPRLLLDLDSSVAGPSEHRSTPLYAPRVDVLSLGPERVCSSVSALGEALAGTARQGAPAALLPLELVATYGAGIRERHKPLILARGKGVSS